VARLVTAARGLTKWRYNARAMRLLASALLIVAACGARTVVTSGDSGSSDEDAGQSETDGGRDTGCPTPNRPGDCVECDGRLICGH
jgi:hypothetical protein